VRQMVDKTRLAKYIQDLERYLRHLAELQKHPLEEFLADWRIYDLADRQLHLALETFLTIGEMIISEFGFQKPDTYADIPQILFENKVIEHELKDRLVDLARLRNVLVHDYLHLDHERVYQHLRADPGVIQEFIDAVKRFVAAK
jgi:uncharacterized protein YutE (UPF0331/DUF86 family)